MIPQYWPPLGVQVAPGQVGEPQELGMPAPPQVWPAGQLLPQSTTPPQPSPSRPQYWPPGSEQVRLGVQPTTPQTWATPPPPQVWPVGQAPQSICASQPSPITPQ